MNAEFARAWQGINERKACVLVSHPKPDGDTLGAALALFHLLSANGTNAQLFCLDAPADLFSYLPQLSSFTHDPSILASADCLVVLDSGDISFSGIEEHITENQFIINIDHHDSNTQFGKINVVEPSASSTCEIIFNLAKELDLEITPSVANCLLTGIVTDTAGFYNAATTSEVLNVASQLVRKGASLSTITRQTLTLRTLAALRAWGVALERLKTDPETDIITTFISHEDLTRCGARYEDLKELSGYIASVKPSKAVHVYVQHEDGTIKCSLRTTRDDVDLAQVAKSYGGGGHKKAAGFKIAADIEESKTNWRLIPKNT